jgi:hypothetical protein
MNQAPYFSVAILLLYSVTRVIRRTPYVLFDKTVSKFNQKLNALLVSPEGDYMT